MITLKRAQEIAALWHSGQSSPLYSFASTGKLWGESHKADVLKELRDNRTYKENTCNRQRANMFPGTKAKANPYKADVIQLNALIKFIEQKKVHNI